jgi:hypothetical protein
MAVGGACAVQANAEVQNGIKIISPGDNTRFALDRIVISVKVAPVIGSVRVVVKSGGKVSYDSTEITLQRGQDIWSPEVPLDLGKNTITVSAVAGSDSHEITVERVQPGTVHDGRDTVEASLYTGLSIDTFAAADLNRYLQQGESGGPTTRVLAGFDVAYRLLGNPAHSRDSQLWFFAETVYGIKSGDVDCAGMAKPTACATPDNLLKIVRGARSLEAFAGLRWEFPPALQITSAHPARLYLKGVAGFLTAAGRAAGLANEHHVAMGGVITNGSFMNSYFEVGYGRSDFIIGPPGSRRFSRWKFDLFLTMPRVEMLSAFKRFHVTPFMQVWADAGPGSDGIQTYIGVEFDLKQLFGK